MEGLLFFGLMIVVLAVFGALAAILGVDSRYDWADDRGPTSMLSA